MKLYYAPGTCALGVHVALIWSGQPYEIEQVELGSEEYKQINPLGAVPALVDGDSGVMSQAESLFHYISAKFPEKKMTGGDSLEERQKYDQWLSFLSSDYTPLTASCLDQVGTRLNKMQPVLQTLNQLQIRG